MDKQYSVEFFTCFVDTVQKLCRDYLNFEQAVELSGYLCLEIDNSKKERYVLSELVQSSGDVISESYCTKAFKTVRKGATTMLGYRGVENVSPRDRFGRERGQREVSSNALYDRGQSSHTSFAKTGDQMKAAGPFSAGIRETRVGRNEKSQDMSSLSFVNQSSSLMTRGVSSGTDFTSSGLQTVLDSEPRALKRTAPFQDETPLSKKDKTHSESSSVADKFETSAPQEALEKESIRLPLAVTIKQEHDVPFMVIDNPEDDASEDRFHDNSEQGNEIGITARENSRGDSLETPGESSLQSRQFQISAGGPSTRQADATTPEYNWGWDTGGEHRQRTSSSGQDMCSYCRQYFPKQDLSHQDPYGSLCTLCSRVLDRTFQQSGNSMIPCTKCSETFSQMASFCQHMKLVHKEETSIDTEIDWSTLCETPLAHSKLPQANRVLKNFPCDMCNKSYTCNSMLLDHINSKHANRSYQCVCGAVFSWRSGLERHKKKCILITQKDISGNQPRMLSLMD